MKTPSIGDLYTSFDEAWHQLCAFSHHSRGSLRVKRRKATCLHLVCAAPYCTFEAFVSYSRPVGSNVKAYHLKRFAPEHSCSGAEHAARGSIHSLEFIKRTVSKHPLIMPLIHRWQMGCQSITTPPLPSYKSGIVTDIAPVRTRLPSGSEISSSAVHNRFKQSSSPTSLPTSIRYWRLIPMLLLDFASIQATALPTCSSFLFQSTRMATYSALHCARCRFHQGHSSLRHPCCSRPGCQQGDNCTCMGCGACRELQAPGLVPQQP